MKRPARGMTLVELLVVVVLIGLAATTVSVQLRGSGSQAQARAAARVVERCFADARRLALLHRRGSLLLLDASGEKVGFERMVDGQRSVAWRELAAARVTNWQAGESRLTQLRVTPAGVWLPWEMEIASSTALLRLKSDGLQVTLEERP